MSVAQTLNEVTSSESFATKWPNDVLSSNGKVAGILCERFGEGIIVGIGVNVSTQVDELPVETATSVFIETGIELNRNDLLAALLQNFQTLFDKWETGEDLTPKYRALSATIGEPVRVLLPNSATIEGVAIGVSAEGELILESGDLINVGDVVHLR